MTARLAARPNCGTAVMACGRIGELGDTDAASGDTRDAATPRFHAPAALAAARRRDRGGASRAPRPGAPCRPRAGAATDHRRHQSSAASPGAVQLPPEGPGWQAVRVSRNRHWGHPAMVAWVQRFRRPGARRRASPTSGSATWRSRAAGPCPWPCQPPDRHRCRHLARPEPEAAPARRAAGEHPGRLPGAARRDRRGPARFHRRHAALIRLAAETAGRRPAAGEPRHQARISAAAIAARPGCAACGPGAGMTATCISACAARPGSRECRDIGPPPPGDGCDATSTGG